MLLEGGVNASQYKIVQSDHFYSIMKLFYPYVGGLLQDDDPCIHMTQRVPEWLGKYEKDMNRMLLLLQLPDLND